MNYQTIPARTLTIAGIAVAAVVLWQYEQHFAAMILLLVTAGVAMARPRIEDRRLTLAGTPVLLMFAVMFVAASGMVYAVDQVGALFDSDDTTQCTAERPLRVSVVDVLREPVRPLPCRECRSSRPAGMLGAGEERSGACPIRARRLRRSATASSTS